MSLSFKLNPNRAVSFDGSQVILLEEYDALRPDRLDAFSVSAWIRASSSFVTIFSGQDDLLGAGLGGQGLHICLLDGLFQFRLWGTGGEGLTLSAGSFTELNDGKWHHVVASKVAGSSNSASVSLYVDGQLSSNTVVEDDLTSTSTVSSGILNIGSRNQTAAFMNGYLREIQFYEYALSSSDVITIYNNGNIFNVLGAELSGGDPSFYWPLNAGPLDIVNITDGYDSTTSGYFNSLLRNAANYRNSYSLQFDGVSQYGSMPHSASLTFVSTTPYTVVAWVAHDGTDGGYVFSKLSGSIRGWGITIENNGRMQHIQIDDSTAATRQGSTNTGVWPSDNKPHLGVWSYDGSQNVSGFVFQMDLETFSTNTVFNSAANTYGNTAEINFAARSSGTGAINKQKQYWVAVYSGLLTDQDKETIYLAGPHSPPPKANRLLTTWFYRNDSGSATVTSYPNDVTLHNSPKYQIERFETPISAGKLDSSFNPIALYCLHNNLTDTSGNSLQNLSVQTGSERYVGYQSGASGFYFSGSDILEHVSTEASLLITGDITIEATYYARDLIASPSILIRMGGTTADDSAENVLYQLAIESDGSLSYFSENGAGIDESYTSSSGIIESGKLYHIIMVRENSIISFYVNGILVSQSTTLTDPTDGSNGMLVIGGNPSGTSGLEPDGVISNIKILNRALLDIEIVSETKRVLGDVYNGEESPLYIPPNAIFAVRSDNVTTSGTDVTVWVDQSGAGNDATGVLATAYPQLDSSTYARPVLSITNAQGYLTLPSAIGNAIFVGDDLPFTIAGITRTDSGDAMMGFGESVGSGEYLRIRNASSNRLQIGKDAGSGSVDALSNINMLIDNEWHAWCIRSNGTTVDMWIDSTIADRTGVNLNVNDCSSANPDGRLFSHPGSAGALGTQHCAAIIISDAAESDAEVETIINNLTAWKFLL